jgi:hypothetical protein
VRIKISALLIVVVAAAAGCGEEPAQVSTTTTVAASTTTTTTEASTSSTTNAPTTTRGGGDVGSDLPPEYAELVAVTEQVRGLEFLYEPELVLVSDEELARRVRQQIEEELDPADLVIDEALFEVLGLLDPSVDLLQAYTDLYAEQVAGFYDSDTGEMVVSSDTELTALGKMIVVHELVHALTDQHFGFAAVMDDLVEAERYHEAAALQALAEGDATYFQIVYFQQLSLVEQVAAVDESLAADTSVLDSLPAWFGEDLSFPYDAGFKLVERIVESEGITGVDQAYRLVPATTEQIIHPDVYFALQPAREVSLPETPLSGYEVYEEGTLGEWNVDLYLLDGVSDGIATVASSGWGGDAYRVLWNGQDVAFVMRFLGDTPGDAGELADALVDSLAAGMSVGAPARDEAAGTTVMTGSDYGFVGFDGEVVTVVVASDPAAGADLVASISQNG